MDLEELYRYAYRKRPLNEVYRDISEVPPEFVIVWLKDSFDYQRSHSEEDLKRTLDLSPEDILNWLEGAVEFVWQTKKHLYYRNKKKRRSAHRTRTRKPIS